MPHARLARVRSTFASSQRPTLAADHSSGSRRVYSQRSLAVRERTSAAVTRRRRTSVTSGLRNATLTTSPVACIEPSTTSSRVTASSSPNSAHVAPAMVLRGWGCPAGVTCHNPASSATAGARWFRMAYPSDVTETADTARGEAPWLTSAPRYSLYVVAPVPSTSREPWTSQPSRRYNGRSYRRRPLASRCRQRSSTARRSANERAIRCVGS